MAIAASVPQFKKGQARHTVKKWVYFFGAGKAEGDGTWRDLLGGKGAGLAEMTKIGLPVPAGFTISTEACDYLDRKSTRLNSSHQIISYAVFCLKKKNISLATRGQSGAPVAAVGMGRDVVRRSQPLLIAGCCRRAHDAAWP